MTSLVLSIFVRKAVGDFASDANALIANHKTVRLDPLLRRALLKALTDLEEEAQHKANEEEAAAVAREEANARLQQAVETADPTVGSTPFDEIQTTADTSYPTPSPYTQPDTATPTPEASTTAPQDITSIQASSQYITSLQTSSQDVTSLQTSPQETTFSQTTSPAPLQTESQTSPAATVQDTFFFQTPTPLDGHTSDLTADLTKAVSLPDIESNLITDDTRFNTGSSTIGTKEDISFPSQEPTTTPLPMLAKQIKAPDNDVDIFKAPLVAAFTLHQDSRGTPKGVVPLFRPQQRPPTNQFFGGPSQLPQLPQFQRFPPLSQQQPASNQNFFIQQSQNAGSFTLSPSQQFQRLQQQPDQFNNNNQFAPNNDFSQQQFRPISGSFGFNSQVASGLQQLPSALPPAVFNQQISSGSVTVIPHSEPLHPNFPSSTFPPNSSPHGFHVSTTIHPQPIQSSTARPITSFQSSTPVTTFTIPPVTLPLQNEPRFQSPIIVQQPSRETLLFLDEQQKRDRLIAEENRVRHVEDQARFRLGQLKRQREAEENRLRALQRQRSTFQRSLGFSFNADQYQPINNNRVNRHEPFASTGNFGINPIYRTIPDDVYRQRNFRSPQQELAQFLFQSGVATHSTGQEDLNIVSKVLALNHERSDAEVQDSQRRATRSPHIPTAESGFVPSTFSQISRLDEDTTAERRQDDKSLLVGEIKEYSGAR